MKSGSSVYGSARRASIGIVIGMLAAVIWMGCSSDDPGGGSETEGAGAGTATGQPASGEGEPCEGGTICGGSCIPTDSDAKNCGGCDAACGADQVCSLGVCSEPCTGGLTSCGGLCVRLTDDRDHCGGCGVACGPDEVCSAGSCGLTCTGGTTKCGAACVDVDVDPTSCGACGRACPAGEACNGGVCSTECGVGKTQCGSFCVSLKSDAANCGACGTACDAGKVCSGGSCGDTCDEPLIRCGEACVNPNIDAANCGACGNSCPAGITCYKGSCAGSGDCEVALTCSGCQKCALDGLCSDEVQRCWGLPACFEFASCVDPCAAGDQACIDTCAMMYPDGIGPYNQIIDCAFCQECTAECEVPDGFCPASCDNKGSCDACRTCAVAPEGLCDDDLAVCSANPECSALFECLGECGDSACSDACASAHPGGVSDSTAVVNCAICQECPIDCKGEQVGCL